MANYTSLEDLIKRGGYDRERAEVIWAKMTAKDRHAGWDGISPRGVPFLADKPCAFNLAGEHYECEAGSVVYIPVAMVGVIEGRGLPLKRVEKAPEGAKLAAVTSIVQKPSTAPTRPPRVAVPVDDDDDEDDEAELEAEAMAGNKAAQKELERRADPPVPAEDSAAAATSVSPFEAAEKAGLKLPVRMTGKSKAKE